MASKHYWFGEGNSEPSTNDNEIVKDPVLCMTLTDWTDWGNGPVLPRRRALAHRLDQFVFAMTNGIARRKQVRFDDHKRVIDALSASLNKEENAKLAEEVQNLREQLAEAEQGRDR